jgi:hypothetical protein
MKPVKITRDNPYYSASGIDFIHVFQSLTSFEQFEGYLLGNALKYLFRYQFKAEGKQAEDLMKAQTYLGWLVELYSGGPKK